MSETLQSLKITRILNSNREKVFAAFSSVENISKWFAPHPEINIDALEYNFVESGKYRLKYSMLDGSKPILGGEFEIIKLPSQLTFTWKWEAPDVHADILTRVHVLLRKMGNKTELTLIHEQIPTQEMAERHARGWNATLDRLVAQI